MADKTELIRQQMAQTRQRLAQKLDALEDRTLGVVKETTEAVQAVAETVEGSVETATKAVRKTVRQSVRALDISRHIEEHPWPAMGGAVAAGFALSLLVSGTRGRRDDSQRRREEFATHGYQPQPQQPAAQPQAASQQSNLLGGLAQLLGPSVDSLKQLAIGTAIGVVKDMALKSVPQEWSQQVGDIINNLTEKLGVEPVEPPQEERTPPASQQAQQERPRWEQERRVPESKLANEPQQKSKKKSHGNGRHPESSAHN